MPLVNYSDSETTSSSSDEEANAAISRSRKLKTSDAEGEDPPPEWSRTKRKPCSANSTALLVNIQPPAPKPASSPLPSLPQTFHSLYATTTRSSTLDDPALHSGRIRQIPHVQGNWPTHIYLEWFPSPIELSRLTHLLDTNIARATTSTTSTTSTTTPPLEFPINTLLHSPLLAPLPLHISLSVPLTLPTALKQPFLDTLSQAITTSTTVKPFSVVTTTTRGNTGTGELDWVCNDDKTRWFLVLRLTRPRGDELNRLLRVCNRVVARFGMRMLYEKANESQDQEEAEQQKKKKKRVAGEESSLPSRLAGGFGRARMEEKKKKTTTTKRRRSNQKERKTRYMAGRRWGAEEETDGPGSVDRSECFHISIAWTLQDPRGSRGHGGGGGGGGGGGENRVDGPSQLEGRKEMEVHFDLVKVKIGNVVHDLPLARAPNTTSMRW